MTLRDRVAFAAPFVLIGAYMLAFPLILACATKRPPAVSQPPDPYYERARQLWCSGKQSEREKAWEYVKPLTVETRLAWLVMAQDDCLRSEDK
jgi:hypothetical protein